MGQGVVGLLGAQDLTGATNTTIYTCPAQHTAKGTLNVSNRGLSHVKIRIALAAADLPVTSEYLKYDTLLLSGGNAEVTGIVLAAGQKVVVYADKENVADDDITVSATLLGIEISTL